MQQRGGLRHQHFHAHVGTFLLLDGDQLLDPDTFQEPVFRGVHDYQDALPVGCLAECRVQGIAITIAALEPHHDGPGLVQLGQIRPGDDDRSVGVCYQFDCGRPRHEAPNGTVRFRADDHQRG